MNKYGELIEKLIFIKDFYRDLMQSDKDAISEACNVLESLGRESE